MAAYLWINPVTLNLYDEEALAQAVGAKGFIPVQCLENHIEIVKEKYRSAVAQSEGCVVDMRCPCAAEYIKKQYSHAPLTFPDIHPILIHCAYELNGRFAQAGNLLYITTPCTSLKLLGQSLDLKNTVFQTWNEFAAEQEIELRRKTLEKSPIPPGFFNDFGNRTTILASQKQFDPFFSSGNYLSSKLVEALYCEDGCHNGDGILEGEIP